jgi:hypothetical protein
MKWVAGADSQHGIEISEAEMADQPEEQRPESSNSVTIVSGGVNANAERIDIGGDVVGRDKVTSASGHIIHAEAGATVIIGEPPPAFKRADHDEEATERKPPTPEAFIAGSNRPTKLVAKDRMPSKRITIGVLVGVALAGILALALFFRPTPIILTNSNWNNYVEDTARSSLSLKAVPGTNHAIDINFDLKQGGWAGLYKKLSLPSFRSIRFLYKGTGAPNTIELKLIDKSETVFEAIWPHTTNTNGQSQAWEPQYGEFRCRKGTGACQDDLAVRSLTLKPEDLDRMDISFSNKSEHADEAGAGQVFIEEIQIIP